jgi:threonine/homoserine/homoserine lactone efflux protein
MEYTALILFILSTSITPGPNNLMIMTSGVNFGLRKSLPHLLGIDIGFPLMLIGVGMGISQLFELVPSLMLWLKMLGVIYLTYLAYKIAMTPINTIGKSNTAQLAKPFTFIQAALFQWVNPKAWIMAVGAVATYTVTSSDPITQVFVIASLFIIFGTPCTVAWLGFGKALKRFLSHPSYQRGFNISMALLLMVSLYPVIAELLKLI